jgi:signal transduction histidine kinase
VELALYRVLQESLRNVSRHAEASHVQVTLMTVGERVQLAVRDDGQGFTPGQADSPGPHLGLASMRERMTLVGGEVAVESAPGAGTSVVAWAPLSKLQAEPDLQRTARA